MSNTEPNQVQTPAFSYLRIADSYTNLLLGIFVVILSALAGFLVTRALIKPHMPQVYHKREITAARTQLSDAEIVKREEARAHIYTVQKGDSLWSIAQTQLHSGYRWSEIATKNHVETPGLIYSGMKLQMPITVVKAETLPTLSQKVKPAVIVQTLPNAPNTMGAPSSQQNTTYTVQRGDNLWNIAVSEYGNGYKWVDIAKANNLANPRIIHAGNVFIIPH